MNKTKQSTQNSEGNVTKSIFWGTIALAGILLLVTGYFVSFLLKLDKTPIIYIGLAVFLFALGASLVSLGLTIRGRQRSGAEIVLYAISVLGITLIAIFQGRAQNASFTILTLSVITIFYLLPGMSRRWYLSVAAVTFIMMWAFEWIDPAWRIQIAAASPGAAAAILFGVILIALAASQAWSGNIRVKLITAFTLVALTSLGILGIVTYTNYRNQVREDIRQRLLNIISITALQQDGDLHAAIQTPEDMQSEAYQQMQATNAAILATDRDLAYIFSARVDEQGKLNFVLDNGLEEGYEPLTVGEVYDDPSTLLAENALTLDHPIVEEDFYTDEYGTFLSAYAPIYKSDGTRAGIVGVDIFATKVIAAEQAVLRLILFTTAIAMVLVTLLGMFLGNVFTNPIIHLSQVAQKIAAGDLNARAEVETTDEVGGLALTLNAMTSQLQGTLQGLEQRVADRTRNLELAAEVGRSVSQVRKLELMLKDACDLILKEFNLYYVQVYLTNPSQTYLNLQAGTGHVGEELLSRSHRLPLNTGSINGRAATEKRSVIISDTTKSATFRPNPLLPNTRSEMAVPLLIGEKVVGVLDMQSEMAGSLNHDLLSAFEALAGQLAIAIQNANLLAETEQSRAEVEAQAQRLSRTNWANYLDAIHRPEETGFVFEQNKVVPMVQGEQLMKNDSALTAPIAVTGEAIGNITVEMEGQSPISRTSDLINTVARQVAQQIESLRLLENAEQYRFEAEEASRRLTREGWKNYKENTSGNLSYLYDRREVRPLNGDSTDQHASTVPLKIRDELIGTLSIQGLSIDDKESLNLATAVAERLSAHIESLRQFDETKRGQVELDKRAQQLAAVAEISTASSKELDTDRMLASVVQLTQRKFDLYHAHIFTFDENTSMLHIAACGWKEGDEHEGTHGTTTIPLEQEQSLVARAARTRQAVIVNDVHNEPGWLPNPLLPDTSSELAVPLVIGDQVLGVLDVQSDRINAFSDEDANIQTTLASQVATALQNARSFTRAQKQAERETTLNLISQKIQSATTVDAVLQIAARELGHALGAPMTIAQLSMKDKEK